MTSELNFKELNAIDVSDYIEKRRGDNGKELSYLSWAYAWAEIKKLYDNVSYEIKKFENNLPYVYDENTGYMVFTSVTIEGKTYEMWLPVMNGNCKAMKSSEYEYTTKNGKKKVEPATMMDINKTIMRCLVKNLAMFGLGLYIYAGDDLPEKEDDLPENTKITQKQKVTLNVKELCEELEKCKDLKEIEAFRGTYAKDFNALSDFDKKILLVEAKNKKTSFEVVL